MQLRSARHIGTGIERLSSQSLDPVRLEVDGGIKPGTAGRVVEAGADILVAGNAVFGEKDYARAIAALREEIK